jgi:hypothetical protein
MMILVIIMAVLYHLSLVAVLACVTPVLAFFPNLTTKSAKRLGGFRCLVSSSRNWTVQAA